MEKEKGGERGGRSINSNMSLFSNEGLSGNRFPPCLLHLPPSFLPCPSTSLVPPISASLSRSIHGRRVWMWIEQQIRSVLIMPVKGGLGEHLSLAPSRNGPSPGSWSPPLTTQPALPHLPAPPGQWLLLPIRTPEPWKSETSTKFSVTVSSKIF